MDYKKILHIDMDAFYASVEQREHPELKGKPLAVGHPGKRGIVAAASYEARRYGIHSAMASSKAKQLCPELIFLQSRMSYYKEVSYQIREIFALYTDLIEPLSLDEAFLDVTRNKQGFELGVDIARAIKTDIREKLGLIASAGISYNKFLAKIASDYKKPDGLYVIHPEKALGFIDRLPIESFWGIGKVTAQKMHGFGIHNGKQLRDCSLEFLVRNFGKQGNTYYNFARGIDEREVEPTRLRKSVGCEFTFENDLTTHTSMIIELNHVVNELIVRLKKNDFKGKTITLKIKYHDFTIKTHSLSVTHPLIHKKEILDLSKKLLAETDLKGKKVRLIGVSISNPTEENSSGKIPTQLTLDF